MPARLKKAQITIFAIIAILIVASVSIFFYLKTQPFAIPAQFKPIEDYFVSCIENKMNDGASLLGSQAGYIELPKFEAGSEYMPSSSQLDFLGTAVPYWFYISGNNIMKQQVPSLQNMEKQLSNFLNEEIKNCDFSEFEKRGYNITIGDVSTSVKIKDESIDASVESPLTVSYGDTSARVTSRDVSVKSKIGKFYNIAKRIYEKEQKELVFENYSLDVLYLYAPVTNVEISCSPKVWIKNDVENELKDALEANIAELKMEGDYYKVKKENNYFVIDTGEKVDENVNLLYSTSWETKIEVWPNEGEVMTAKPVGTESGLGILGFCYVPYHFVYDVAFPIMIQIYDQNELFQFPVVVSIEKNQVRGAVQGEGIESINAGICGNRVKKLTVRTLDSDLKPIQADIKFKCLNEECDVGETKIKNEEAILETAVPPCIGSSITSSASGYAESKLELDTNEEANAVMVMNKLYKLNIEFFVGGAPISKEENAIITFDSGNEVKTISYPAQNTIELSEGYYNISTQVYRKGNLIIGSQKTRQCVKTPATGLGGFFGMQDEQCVDVEMPSQTLTQIVSGGGSTSYYITEDNLKNARKISISSSIFALPKTIMDLQNIYDEIENSRVDVSMS